MRGIKNGLRGHLIRVCRDDRGAAIATVALLGTALVLLATVVVTASVQSYQHTASDRGFEEAFHIAEGGGDDVLYDLSQANPVPESADVLGTKDEVVAAAEALVAADPTVVQDAPDGDVVAFKDDDSHKIYSVGFAPSFDDPRRKVRVLEIQYTATLPTIIVPAWNAEFALLSGGDVTITGSAGVNNPGADVHANGALDASSGSIEGCGSESVDSGYVEGPGCPASPAPPVPVPVVDPYMAYGMSWYDMCPDGQAHAGPAHPTTPNSTMTPCAGPIIPGRMGMIPTASGWQNLDKNSTPGVYYVIGDFDGRVGFRNNLPITIITAKSTAVPSPLDCTIPGGDVWLTSQSSAIGHPSAGGLTIVSSGDIVFRGGADFTGMLLAHEQIDYRGNSSVTGAVIAEDACNTAGSPKEITTLTGTADIYWVGPVGTPFDAEVEDTTDLPTIGISNVREL